MAILLGLLAGLTYGIGDFYGGLSTKRTSVLYVIGGAHLVGLFGATLVSVVIADRFSVGSLVVGGIAGLFGGSGLMLLFRGLAVGPMFIVAPTTAVASAAVPVAWDVSTGGRLSWGAYLGVGLALVSLVLASYVPRTSDEANTQIKIILQSLLSGSCFGILFIMLDWADPQDAPWPLVGARLATTIPVGLYLFARSRRSSVDRARGRSGRMPFTASKSESDIDRSTLMAPATMVMIALSGTMDTLANGLFIFAADRGELATVSVLVSLYPLSTILMARFVLNERMTPIQYAGLGLALAGTGLMALA